MAILTWWKCPKEKTDIKLQKNEKVLRLVLPPPLTLVLALALVLALVLALALVLVYIL
jgi:uncharacterized protein involved in exopolysaccharide biosynthesis